MLKQLVTHWKAHRKKPTLLPEDTEVHFEETSTVNPIFEDNESAITSEALGELSAVIDSFASDLESHDSVATNENLIDINPVVSHQVALESTTKKFEDSFDIQTKQSDVVSVANVKADVGGLKSESSKENHSYLHSKAGLDLARIAKSEPAVKKVSKAQQQLAESSNVRENVDSTKEESSNDDRRPIEVTNSNDNLQSDMIIKVPEPPVIIRSSKLSTATNKPPNVVGKIEKSDERLPVIADLIKKFQSPSENVEQDVGNSQNVEQKKVSDEKRADIIRKAATSNKTEAFKPEKEALSKIFNFPPPPPIEPIKSTVPLKPNKSFLASVASSSKNTSAFKDLKTRSDSSLDRNKTVSSKTSNAEKLNTKTETISLQVSEKKEENKSDTNDSVVLSRLQNESSVVNTAQTSSQKLTRSDSTTSVKKTLENIIENRSLSSGSFELSRSQNDSSVINATQKQTRTDSATKEKKVLENIIENSSLDSESVAHSRLSNESSVQKVTHSDSTAKEKMNLENIIAVKQIKTDQPFSDALPSTSSHQPTGLYSTQNIPPPKFFPNKYKESGEAKTSPLQEPNKKFEVKRDRKPQEGIVSQMEAKSSAKSHSEDSGITRGDQISSEATQDNPESQQHSDKDSLRSDSTKKTKRERKVLHHRTRSCKHCRRSFAGDDTPLKRGKCDDYYDHFIGAHRNLRKKHSESWASDLSWEERELIRKLRSRRALRSDSSSSHSQRHKPESGYFHRPHALRRSLSDDGSFLGSPMCTCDECWMHLIKYYAYGRSSLRGCTSREDLCTCRARHPDLISRKVKFQSDIIPEVSSSDRTTLTTPTIPEESEKKEDTTNSSDDKKTDSSSKDVEKSKKSKEKSIDIKTLKEKYRLMTPWEMEEWDLAMRKQLLIKRRRRARNMGLMALAMIILIGLIVTGVMIYLRRRTL